MSGPDPMNARASRVRWATVLAASAGLAATPLPSFAVSVQEALLLAVPAVALVSAEVKASATVNCGQGPITVSPKPFIEVGTGWFVDGRGYLITNAHVIDPAYRLPPWVEFDLKLRAVDQTSAEVGPHVGQHVVLRDALALPVLLQNGSTQEEGSEHVQAVR